MFMPAFKNIFSVAKTESRTNRIIMLILLCFPAILLTINGGIGVLFFLLFLISLVRLYRMRASQSSSHWDNDSIAFAIAMASPILSIFLSQAYHNNFYAPAYDWASRFLFAIPIFLVLRRINRNVLNIIQYAWPLGALLTFLLLIFKPYVWFVGDEIVGMTTSSAFNRIHFSDCALIIGFLSLFCINFEGKDRPLLLAFKLCGFMAGLYMAIQSGERGGWLAIPFLLLLWAFSYSKKNRWLEIGAAVLTIITAILLSYFVIDVVHHRINLAVEELSTFANGNKDTSVGVRLQLWLAAINMFIANPIFGVGPNGFEDAMPMLSASGQLTAEAARLGHAEVHSEILAKCAGMGLFGLFSILSVFVVPLYIFWRSSKSKVTYISTASFMGICLVLGFFIFGLTAEIFNLRMTAAFFSLTLAVLMATATHKSVG